MVTPHGKRQPQHDSQRRSSGGAPEFEVGVLARPKLFGRGWNDPRKLDDWDVLTGDLYTGCEGNSLHPKQQEDTDGGRGLSDGIIYCHSNDSVSDSHPCGRAAYGQGMGRPEWVSEIPGEYVNEGNRLELAEDPPTEVSSDYALDNCYTLRHVGHDWDEERQAVDFGQPCGAVNLQQAVDIGYYPVQDDEYKYAEHGLGHEENHLGLARDNFWRRHRLG